MAHKSKKKTDQPTVVKKYANRRLYDTGRSSYVTLNDLYEMVKEGHDFVVYDAKTGEDLTRSVLTQIIVEKEASAKEDENMLPISFLKELISYYDENMQPFVPAYLEQSMQHLANNQEEFTKYFERSLESMFSVDTFEEASRRNMELLQNTINMFTPFGTESHYNTNDPEERANEIQKTIKDLEKELNELKKKTSR